MSNAAVSAVRQWLAPTIQQMPFGTNFKSDIFDVDAGFRCFEIVDPAVRVGLPDVPRHAYRASAHLGLDGGAAVGLNLVVNENAPGNSISQEFLFVQIFSALYLAVSYATTVAGASGDALVRMKIPVPGLPAANEVDKSLRLVAGTSSENLSQVAGSRLFNSASLREFVSEHTIDLDAAGDSFAGLAAAAVRPYIDVINAFGVAEPKTITTDGVLRLIAWHSGYKQGMQMWATQYGVPVEE